MMLLSGKEGDYSSMKPSMKHFFLPLAAIALASVAGAAQAFDPMPEMIDARSLALAGAVTSLPSVTSAARANPAALAPIRGFYGGISYVTRRDNQFDALAVTVVDNSSSPIAGALQYYRSVSDQETEDIGLSMASGSSSQFWGATARYVHGRNQRDDGWDGAFVADAGVLLLRESGLSIGIAARDLFATTFDVLSPRAALGVSYNNIARGTVLVTADFTRYFDREFSQGHRFGIGLEWTPLQSYFVARAGELWDAASDTDAFSLGVGWRREGMEAGYAFQQNRQDASERLHLFTVSASF